MDNYSKRAGPYTSNNYIYRSQRPSTSSTTTVPSRKDKYIRKDAQNDNSDKKNNYNTEQVNQNINRGRTVNFMKYMKSTEFLFVSLISFVIISNFYYIIKSFMKFDYI